MWSVTAIAPSPTRLAVSSSVVDRRRAVGRVVGVHVQVHVDEVARRRAAAARPAGRSGSWRRAAISSVQLLELVGDPRPVELGRDRGDALRLKSRHAAPARRPGARAGRPASTASRGSNSRPQLAVAQRLLVLTAGRDTTGTAPPASARSTQLRRRRGAGRGRHGDRARAPGAGPRSRRPDRRSARARAARRDSDTAGAEPGSRDQIVARQSSVERQPPQRAQEQPQRRPLLLGGEDDLRAVPSSAPPGAGAGRRPAGSPGSRRGSSARQVAGGGEAGRAAVEAAEQQLDHAARHLRRDERARWSSGTCRR